MRHATWEPSRAETAPDEADAGPDEFLREDSISSAEKPVLRRLYMLKLYIRVRNGACGKGGAQPY